MVSLHVGLYKTRRRQERLVIPIPDMFSQSRDSGLGNLWDPGGMISKTLFLNIWAYIAKFAFICPSVTGLFI